MNIIGIDPGVDGAVALISEGRKNVELYRFKNRTELDIVRLIEGLVILEEAFVVLELVGGMPGQGGPRSFNFGRGVGVIAGMLWAHRIAFEEHRPQAWQKALGLAGSFETKALRKRAHLAKAQHLYPRVDMTLASADALLIAEYGYRLKGEA